MASPKWKVMRRVSNSQTNTERVPRAHRPFSYRVIATAVVTVAILYLVGFFRVSGRFLLDHAGVSNLTGPTRAVRTMNHGPIFVFIAIGSAPRNVELRDAARDGWLQWLPSDGSVQYRFFSDARPGSGDARANEEVWDLLETEEREKGDLVLQPLETGYGNNRENAYGKRARYQISWSLKQYESVDFFLRIDDDSFLCLHRLLYELKAAPRRQFFWGRYWCREGRSRADENFMLFSGDVVQLLGADEYVGKLIPFDDSVTLGWNFGFLSWVLNLTIFDDQERLDAQQGYLTDYMHAKQVTDPDNFSQFCESYIYAHHVRSAAIMLTAFKKTNTHLMYPIPERTTPRETCPNKDASFIAARHSHKLPNVKFELPV